MFAFFDVDETLISVKSMFDFYDYYLAAVGLSEREQREAAARARALLGPGVPRAEANQLFYRRFAGCEAAEVTEIGRGWFADHQRRGGLFHGDVLAALREHKAAGARVVFLSGSFRAVLDPVAEYCGADVVCCTELEVRDGVLTGGIARAMIGDAKAEAARELLAESGVAAGDCHAYGDHSSDLGLLRLVGHPVAVGADPELATVAAGQGWRSLAGVPG